MYVGPCKAIQKEEAADAQAGVIWDKKHHATFRLIPCHYLLVASFIEMAKLSLNNI